MPTIRFLPAGLLPLALAVVAAAPAAAASPTQLPPGVTIPKVTGLELVRASYEVRHDWRIVPDRSRSCAAYVKGDGTQLMEVELKKPTDYALVQIGRTIQLSPSNRPPRFSSAISRLFDWDRKLDECACGPNSEYGECPPPGPPPKFDCTPRIDPGKPPAIEIRNGNPRRTGVEDLDDLLWSEEPDTTLSVLATPGKRFEDCPPSGESAGHALDLPLIDATSWTGGGWIRRLAALKPGQRATLTERTLRGVSEPLGREAFGSFRRCPPKPRVGVWRCEKGEVSLTFEGR